MSDSQIIELYDSNLSLTLKQLSIISGKPLDYLKKLLMS